MSGETRTRVGTPTDVGSRLRAAREAKQLSVHAIAKTTKIPVGALEALEENDVARLPGGIFSRGFVRSYAAAVGLNPEQTLRDFVAQLPAHETATGAASDDRPHGYHQSTRQRRVAGLGLGVLLVWSAGGYAPLRRRHANPHRYPPGAGRRGGTGPGAFASSGDPGPGDPLPCYRTGPPGPAHDCAEAAARLLGLAED